MSEGTTAQGLAGVVELPAAVVADIIVALLQPESVDEPECARLVAELRLAVRASRHELPALSITCPRCGLTSHNSNDVRAGYCGACQDWTTHR